MARQGISVRRLYSTVSDSHLDDLVRSIVRIHPHAGYRMVQAYLFAEGYRLSEKAVRSSLERIDPIGMAQRWCRHRCINRRVYYAPHPNAVWHIDGNMSLIRWRVIIHGGVDGFSRVITYLKCSSNNRSSTVLKHFIAGTSTYGCPSRVRSDRGGENIDVARIMLLLRGVGRSSHITGQSTRNQRVERLWRDVFENCLHLFYNLFYLLEDNDVLDPENELHLLALHYIFLPRIQKSLQEFQKAWNTHGLSSAQHSSPLQLWTSGMLVNRSLYRSVDEIFDTVDESSSDSPSETDESSSDDSESDLGIERILAQTINPLDESIVQGVDLYAEALRVVLSHYS